MKIENVKVYGFENALHGMRNPKESWEKSDTLFDVRGYPRVESAEPGEYHVIPQLGPNDRKLALSLIRRGTDHRKFLRQIFISLRITIPRYIWQELDTYKVATTRNSCSTMHKLGHRNLTVEDFQDGDVLPLVLHELNRAGGCYRAKIVFVTPKNVSGTTRDLSGYDIVRWMKKHLPESFLQMATYTLSYETALAAILSRGNHRNAEWSGPGGIVETLRGLPLMLEFERALVGEPGVRYVRVPVVDAMIADFERLYPGAGSDLPGVLLALCRAGCSFVEKSGSEGKLILARSIENLPRVEEVGE